MILYTCEMVAHKIYENKGHLRMEVELKIYVASFLRIKILRYSWLAIILFLKVSVVI